MKYATAPYSLTKDEDMNIRTRKSVFLRETGTHKSVLVTIITPYGLNPGGYSNDIPCQVTMEDLFK